MKRLISILAVALVAIAPATGSAATVALNATLNGSQEVPSNDSFGLGSAAMLYDTSTNELTFAIIFTGLSGPLTGAHFHGPAPEGSNAGVQIDIGAIAGLGSPMFGSATLTDDQETDLLDNLWYINLHTADFPGGEIRGQVIFKKVIPIPAAAWLFASSLIALGAVRRRTR